jgi:hypothetical protein
MLRKHSWCGALFDSDGHFNMSRRVGDPLDWILRAGEQGAVIELLSDLLVYERTHENHLRRRENVSGSPPPVRQNIHG